MARSLLVLMGKAAEALEQSAAAARYFERAAGTRAPGMETDR